MTESNLVSLEQNIKARAESLGFCLCGVTNAEPLTEHARYENWLAANRHGSMDYLNSTRHRVLRRDPKTLVPWCKSIIVLAWPYKLNYNVAFKNGGQIAGYVGEEDYHEFLPRILKNLIDDLQTLFSREVHSQVFCDSAPILERELAGRAGLGWIGRNSNLINPKFGSAFLLAEVFIDQEIPVDSPLSKDLCGNCHRCIEACPAECILPDRTIDANRCIAALTIESKGLLLNPEKIIIGNRLFGCDVCQVVCPWNRRGEDANAKNVELSEQEMIALLHMDESSFRTRFRHTAFWRSKRAGFIRNLCTVLGNLPGTVSQNGMAQLVKNDPDLVICVSAAGALMEINPDLARALIAGRLFHEINPQIIEELTRLIK
jgi:epoxyqueuosine reductase